MTERQAGLDAVHDCFVNHDRLGHVAFLFGAFARQKVAPRGFVANNFAGRGDLESLGHGLACFASCYGFWHWKRVRTLASAALLAIKFFSSREVFFGKLARGLRASGDLWLDAEI